MASTLDQIRDTFECPIDFEGQRKAERYAHLILIPSAVLGFVVGFIMHSVLVTLAIYGVGFIAAILVSCPPWPMYNQHPISWLPAQDHATGSINTKATEGDVVESRKER